MPGPSPDAWPAERGPVGALRVDRVPLSEPAGWSVAPGTGDLRHDSGRFFSVEGLSARRETGPVDGWSQPVLVQSDIGVLGLLAKEFDGVPHFLMRAKTEPGNATRTQLRPTVQATRSHYTGVHGGSPVPYPDHFLRPGRGRVLVDVLQSETGSWFHRKRNRNMVVEVLDDVPVGDDFRWTTRGEVLDRLRFARRAHRRGVPFPTLEEAARTSGFLPEELPVGAGARVWPPPDGPQGPSAENSRAILRRFCGEPRRIRPGLVWVPAWDNELRAFSPG
ncbi:NDP-hexose 2,3-dehydratase family protein [Streptomyces sp. NE5-10]|uniref:NDP-hexose 2,3-dehydratase family protein n=1 Tax=Streptomyces sp. NE5-10 TaxID=2759674 RepID=UPI00190667FC|nr:NDP-hexose 2,3-dehydratase family protein [Streptomyces sp. NE5-10]